jgi:cytochrome c553
MKKIIAMMCGAAVFVFANGAVLAGNPEAGREKAKTCAACHGPDGNGAPTMPDAPKLAGQHADYLIKSLQSYKAGTRKNPIMAPMASPLTQREIEDLAAFYSRQQGLTTFK